jgi:peptide/nickel transport system substrate-binding protein
MSGTSKALIGRREFLGAALTLAGAAAVAACAPQGSTGGSGSSSGGGLVGKLEGPMVVTDPAKFPKQFKEAPQLAALVKQGKLPPVAQRIGRDPLVIQPVHEIGKYGGTLRRGFTGPGDTNVGARLVTGPDRLLYVDNQTQKVVPNIAKGYEVSGDGKTTTIHLRRGMRWSDGQPFTADDIMFWYQDMYLDKDIVRGASQSLTVGGKQGVIEKVDDATVRFTFSTSFSLFPQMLAGSADLAGLAGAASSTIGNTGMGGYAPAHYLKQFHAKYTPAADLDQKVKAGQFRSWPELLKNRATWFFNPELPVLSPWRTVQPINTSNWVLERNPYSIWVDTEGNQLPYIDRVSMELVQNNEVLNLQAAEGAYELQDYHLDVAKLPVLLQNQQKSGYRLHMDQGQGDDLGIRVNLSYEADPEIAALLSNVDFRRALSLGIDRGQVKESVMAGLGEPRSAAPGDDNKYFPGDKYRTLWATHDPKQANQLLDRLGLTKKDQDGFRLRKDGKGRLQLAFAAVVGGSAPAQALGEMVRQHWKAIGIFLDLQTIDPTLVTQRARANQLQLWGIGIGGPDPFIEPTGVFPCSTSIGSNAALGALYARWFETDGAAGKEPPSPMKQVMDLWHQGRAASSDAQRAKAGKQMWQIIVDQVYQIGVIGMGPGAAGLRLSKNTVGNVPERIVASELINNPLNMLAQSMYLKQGGGSS